MSGTDLSWLPTDAEEQLSLGFRIISNAYKTRVQSLEGESRSLRHQLEERAQQMTALQKKHSSLEVEMIESRQRANQLAEENKSLISTVKKLHRDIQRLETLKQAVLSSIQEGERDDDHGRVYHSSDFLQTAAPLTMQELTGQSPGCDPFTRFTKANDLASPSPSTTTAAIATIDGKKFFRAARGRLSFESFNNFLAEIQKLNNQGQTREVTLQNTKDIFGDVNADLYEEFKQLLIRGN